VNLGNVGSDAIATTGIVNVLNTPGVGFNTVTTTSTSAAFNTRFIDNIPRVGFNYRSGGPAVAKY
jgi:outer membrane immunogenic protein